MVGGWKRKGSGDEGQGTPDQRQLSTVLYPHPRSERGKLRLEVKKSRVSVSVTNLRDVISRTMVLPTLP